MITAKIILDSINPAGIRLTTFEVKYPKFIHGEIMTHRALSRNAASSRAIPINKMMDLVSEDTARPEFWAQNEKGMQATGEVAHHHKTAAYLLWNDARDSALKYAGYLRDNEIHKAIVNRILEPFAHITVVITATYYKNFFALRAHPMAQQEFQVLAYRMLNCYLNSSPQKLDWSAWHLPYITDEDWTDGPDGANGPELEKLLVKVSAARCARVSYLNQDGKRDLADDIALHDRLIAQIPKHASALEHPAQAIEDGFASEDAYCDDMIWEIQPLSNFHPSWKQYRKTIKGENIYNLDLKAVMATKPDWITL